MQLNKPISGQYPAYYDTYFLLVDDKKGILDQLHEDAEKFGNIISKLPQDKWHYAYAENKWTVFSLIQHVIDCERIMTYRALCIARGEKQMLPGFEENDYAKAANMQHKTSGILALEWMAVRQATLSFFIGLNDQECNQIGNANNNPMSVSALAYIIVGHSRHHFNILAERYFGNK